MLVASTIKQKITILLYIILSLSLVYTRTIDYDFEFYKIVKYTLIPSLISYYLVSAKKKNYRFLLIVFFYYLADVVFTISPWHQFFGFSSLILAQITFSGFLLNKMHIISLRVFYSVFFITLTLLTFGLLFFYETEMFHNVLLTTFFSSILVVFIIAYIHYSKKANWFSFLMLIATLLLVFSNFMSTLNYFIYKSFLFSGLSSLAYVAFLFCMVRSILIERGKEQLSTEIVDYEVKKENSIKSFSLSHS